MSNDNRGAGTGWAASSAHPRESVDAGLWRERPFPCARVLSRRPAPLGARLRRHDDLGSRKVTSRGNHKVVDRAGLVIARQARQSKGPSNAPRSPGPLRSLGPSETGVPRRPIGPRHGGPYSGAGAYPTVPRILRRLKIPSQELEKIDSAPGNLAPVAANGERRQRPGPGEPRAGSRHRGARNFPPQRLEKIDSTPGNLASVAPAGERGQGLDAGEPRAGSHHRAAGISRRKTLKRLIPRPGIPSLWPLTGERGRGPGAGEP